MRDWNVILKRLRFVPDFGLSTVGLTGTHLYKVGQRFCQSPRPLRNQESCPTRHFCVSFWNERHVNLFHSIHSHLVGTLLSVKWRSWTQMEVVISSPCAEHLSSYKAVTGDLVVNRWWSVAVLYLQLHRSSYITVKAHSQLLYCHRKNSPFKRGLGFSKKTTVIDFCRGFLNGPKDVFFDFRNPYYWNQCITRSAFPHQPQTLSRCGAV